MVDGGQAAKSAQERAGDSLAVKLSKIVNLAKSRREGFVIPELDADPAVDDPTNLWLLADGRLRSRTLDGTVHQYDLFTAPLSRPALPSFATDPIVSTGWRMWTLTTTGELRVRLANNNVVRFPAAVASTSTAGGDADLATPSGTSAILKPADPTPATYYGFYPALWARAFCQVHGLETGAQLSYGYFDEAHGNRRIMFGFDDALIRADTAGSTIRNFSINFLNTAAWSAEVDIHIGTHNVSAAPATFSAVRRNCWTGTWPDTGYGGNYHDSLPYFGECFRDNSIKGLTIDQDLTRSGSGAMDWSTFSLYLIYTK